MNYKAAAKRFLGDRFSSIHSTTSYSQEGEDLIVEHYFAGQGPGTFVDVGAHHPYRFSNTYKLYQMGWTGINIDPLPGSMRLFKQARPRDTNLEIGIAEQAGELTYYEFDEPALNGFSQELSQDRHKSSPYKILRTSKIAVKPLSAVLAEHLASKNSPFRVLTVDAEGFDLSVLRSNDWARFKPKVVIAELRQPRLEQIVADPIYEFLTKLNYRWFACTGRSCFFESY